MTSATALTEKVYPAPLLDLPLLTEWLSSTVSPSSESNSGAIGAGARDIAGSLLRDEATGAALRELLLMQ